MVLSGQGENTGIHSLLTCETSPELTYCNSCGQKQKILLFITNPAWLTTTHLLISRGKKWLNTLVLFSLVLSSFRPDDLLDPFRQFSVFSNREVVSCSEAALSSPPLPAVCTWVWWGRFGTLLSLCPRAPCLLHLGPSHQQGQSSVG